MSNNVIVSANTIHDVSQTQSGPLKLSIRAPYRITHTTVSIPFSKITDPSLFAGVSGPGVAQVRTRFTHSPLADSVESLPSRFRSLRIIEDLEITNSHIDTDTEIGTVTLSNAVVAVKKKMKKKYKPVAIKVLLRFLVSTSTSFHLLAIVFKGLVAWTGKRPATGPNPTECNRTLVAVAHSPVKFRLPVSLLQLNPGDR